jgi:polyribonucleotide nucleotidyltransferase
MTIIREGAQLGDTELFLETGRMAKQADGSVRIGYGDSQVLCTATDGGPKDDLPFFPLLCDYVENYWSAGSIPGGYFKREGKPGDKATLTSRLIDRPCRPLFPDGFQRDIQLVAWVISADRVNDTDVLGITGCSAALMLSDIPWNGPVCGVRIGHVDGDFVANPTFEQREESELDLVMATSKDGIAMVEGEGDEVSEQMILDAMSFGVEASEEVLDLQIELAEEVGKEKYEFESPELDEEIVEDVREVGADKIKDAFEVEGKLAKDDALDAAEEEVTAELQEEYPEQVDEIGDAFDKLKKELMREKITTTGERIDGRELDEVRPIDIEVGLIPEAHGSCLFTRGSTQALATTTLGTEELRVDSLEDDYEKNFFLHYNFPDFSVGETAPFRSTSRRETGHGMLAERSLRPLMPNLDDFPYTVRVVSDILESNGSSSMASVCGGSLSMMDAGIEVEKPTAGVAMGLIREDDDVKILTDILGLEDFMGDMDFKIAGSYEGITAFQLDTKIQDLSQETMAEAMEQAREARHHILDEMTDVLAAPREELSPNAPRITSIQIPTDKIGNVIGSGGKTIRSIQDSTDTTINIDDDGTVTIAADDGHSADQAIEIIEGLTAEPEEGETYMGTVQTITGFGAFIEILPGTDGLCHISELTEGRVDEVEDVLEEGEECLVKVLKVGNDGKIKLSRKEALAEKADEDEEVAEQGAE